VSVCIRAEWDCSLRLFESQLGTGTDARTMTVLSLAQDALETGPLCDHCLGRLVADRSFGLSNDQRGNSLRIALALEEDADYEAPDECWVCENECDRFEWWVDQAVGAVHGYEFDTYQIGTKVPPLLEENDKLLREDIGLEPEAGELLKSEYNREIGKRFGERTDTTVDFGRPDVLLVCDLATDEIDVQVNSAFVYGRYRKIERDIPQTRWPCSDCNGTGRVQGDICDGCDGSGYRYDESVEQLACPHVSEAMDGTGAVFHGAGREDVDALMLGTGRPFVIEVDEPRKRAIDTDALEAQINEAAEGKIEVEGLRPAAYDMVERVKEHEASKQYRMTVEFDEPVTSDALADALDTLTGATIEQDTPKRVSHRRAAKTRVRDVYDATGELTAKEGADEKQDQSTTATIKVHGAGGLYVKELVSSDEGRTEPSLAGLLGVAAEVTALDVLAVEGEEEPFEQDEFFLDA